MPEALPASAPDTLVIDQYVNDIKERESAKAGRIGDIADGFREEAQTIIVQAETPDDAVEGVDDPEVLTTIASASVEQRQEIADTLNQHADQLDAALGGNDTLAVDQSLEGSSTMGYAQVGGGVETINLNAQVVVHAATEGDSGDIQDLIAHETAHATEQKPMEDVVVQGTTVTAWQLHEAHSEFHGQEARGKGIGHHRDGQPQDYAEAQDAGLQIVDTVGRETFDAALADGDSEALQTHVWVAALDDGSLTVDELLRQAAETGYQRAAEEALKKHYKLAA